jgi:predicted RNA-binding protein (virulence factor B family)
MIEIGLYNDLVVLREAAVGLYLGDSTGTEEVLLPKRYVPQDAVVGDTLHVFVYLDNENRPVATTLKPYATSGEFAFLRVKELNQYGAFFDWGIDKDVFSPYSEHIGEVEEGEKYLLGIFIDERSGRIAASLKWNQFIDNDTSALKEGEKVNLLIAQETDFGYKAIINNQYQGLLYRNEVFEPLQPGDVKTGYIKQVRDDGKVDLSLQLQGYGYISDTKQIILEKLKAGKGFLSLGDKSSPDEIYAQLNMSKKVFKKTIGGLFKDRLITISDYEIRIADDGE